MKRIYVNIILVLGLVLFIVGCNSTPKTKSSGGSELTLGSISWMIEQISPSFWPATLDNNSDMFVSFFIPFSDTVGLNDVETVSIFSPRDFWTLNSSNLVDVAEVDSNQNQIVIKRLQCAGGGVPLGEWYLEVKVKGQEVVTQKLNVTGIGLGGSTSNSISYMVAKAEKKNEIEALAVPVINSVSKDVDNIEIKFSVNDKRIKNGYFWFDVPGEKYYRDSGSMIDASGNPVNGCRKFSTDGNECLYILRKDAENEEWFEKIRAVYFVASETNRVQSPWEERHRTVSGESLVK